MPSAIDAMVVLGLAYATFMMTLAGWVAALRKGQAVTLLPGRSANKRTLWAQIAFTAAMLAVFGAVGYLLWIPVTVPSPGETLALSFLGFALFATGLATTVWARQTLGAMWGISTSREVKLLPEHHLIRAGPYGLVRHPMYFGWWLSALGLVLLYPVWIVLIVFLMSLVVFYRRARLEETVLEARFGEEWRAYAAQTRFILPFVY